MSEHPAIRGAKWLDEHFPQWDEVVLDGALGSRGMYHGNAYHVVWHNNKPVGFVFLWEDGKWRAYKGKIGESMPVRDTVQHVMGFSTALIAASQLLQSMELIG